MTAHAYALADGNTIPALAEHGEDVVAVVAVRPLGVGVAPLDVLGVDLGQTVEVGLDAYPDKKLAGKVIRVANVGEERPNSDAKVFEVSVEIQGTDPTLRPSMTTRSSS